MCIVDVHGRKCVCGSGCKNRPVEWGDILKCACLAASLLEGHVLLSLIYHVCFFLNGFHKTNIDLNIIVHDTSPAALLGFSMPLRDEKSNRTRS